MKFTAAALSLAAVAVATPVEPRQSCPKVYVFGARETTAGAGYGTAGGLVNQVVAAYSGTGSEAIVYPACGGQSSCGGVSYDNSASQGTAAVVKAVTAYNQKCPSTQIVLIGYSQVNSSLHRKSPERNLTLTYTFSGRTNHGQRPLRRSWVHA
jgi:acetylxylan esterase